MQEINRIIHRAVHWLRPALVVGAVVGLSTITVTAAADKPATEAKSAIDPQADEWLKRMGDYLAQAPFFSVNAEIWQDIQLSSGERLQVTRVVDLQVRRPDRFHAEVHSARRNRGLYYDGKTITLFNRVQNFYGAIPAPGSIDEALDVASDRFGITMPLEDLIVSDPYHNAIGRVITGRDFGTVTVLGVPCEHLGFTQDRVDWQVWIECGAKPVPRKIVITYKDEEGSPQYTAIFSNWDFLSKLPDFLFTFEVPAGAAKINVEEIKSENQAHHKEGK